MARLELPVEPPLRRVVVLSPPAGEHGWRCTLHPQYRCGPDPMGIPRSRDL